MPILIAVVALPAVSLITIIAHEAVFSTIETFFVSIYFRISYERVAISANYLMERTKHRPKIAIICGSGLGNEY